MNGVMHGPIHGMRAVWRLGRSVLHVLHGMAVMLRFPALDAAARHERIRWWSAGLLRHIGMTLQVSGTAHPGATLLVANHVSWLDIFVINALHPSHFVAKSEIRDWPVLGWLADKGGTVFIARGNRRELRHIGSGRALRCVHPMPRNRIRGNRNLSNWC